MVTSVLSDPGQPISLGDATDIRILSPERVAATVRQSDRLADTNDSYKIPGRIVAISDRQSSKSVNTLLNARIMAQTYWFLGAKLSVLFDEQQTNGQYDLIEGSFSAGAEVPLHLHTKYSEVFYVTEGAFTFYIGSEVITLVPGESVYTPINTPHRVVASDNPVNRGLTIASPSAFRRLIRAGGTPVEANSLPPVPPVDMGRFMKLSEEIGDVLLCPPGALPPSGN